MCEKEMNAARGPDLLLLGESVRIITDQPHRALEGLGARHAFFDAWPERTV